MSELVLDKRTVPEWLDLTDYSNDEDYVPSEFALDFVNFIKLVNGSEGEQNKTPVVHYKMLDNTIIDNGKDTINMCHRGIAKSTLLGEYLFLYIATYGELGVFGKVPFALYVSDSIDNGVKKMRKNLEFRWEKSQFLQKYLPVVKFTDIRWEFKNINGDVLVVSGYGAKTGVRGTREQGSRPVLAVLDDLISDEDARSPTVLSSVEDTVYKAIDYALDPQKRKIIWSGTPFNASDPLYKAVESGAWNVNAYPVCEKFPCTEEEFKGSWEDRFNYDYVKRQHDKAKAAGKIDTFNQELMLRIMSDDDRLIQDHEIKWYDYKVFLKHKNSFNFYITTDLAVSEKASADFVALSVWGLNSSGHWFWVDGVLQKQLMDATMNDLFRLVRKWNPMSVGIEVSGQQGGFIPWIESEMMARNTFFTLASDGNSNRPGIRPVTDKLSRFNLTIPWFKQGRIHFPMSLRYTPIMKEAELELTQATPKGFKSRHDDFIDTISMLVALNVWAPSATPDEDSIDSTPHGRDYWAEEDEYDEPGSLDSYLV